MILQLNFLNPRPQPVDQGILALRGIWGGAFFLSAGPALNLNHTQALGLVML